ncbi:hypothetical protein M404DRAFT_320096 [Pisolithus tinctorius Marx 270]|uniref:Uncharacterized protein n=1 Tax=Pisolithus tinctorius Marx 270 TaxID=870435 RepID=A0A0C3NIY3_PISTI|nr:hypothetical protein M404DRAFT_320096 [Pisolithus tinctorius Marx 270]
MSIPGLICKRVFWDCGLCRSRRPFFVTDYSIRGLGRSSTVFEKLFHDRTLLKDAYLVSCLRLFLHDIGVRYDLTGVENQLAKRYTGTFDSLRSGFHGRHKRVQSE